MTPKTCTFGPARGTAWAQQGHQVLQGAHNPLSGGSIPLALRMSKRSGTTATDVELLRAHVEGDERAFAELMDRIEPQLRGWLFRKFHFDRETLNDVLQETFWRAHKHAARFDGTQSAVRSWIFMIGKNLSINTLRNRSKAFEVRWPQVPLKSARMGAPGGDIEFPAIERPDRELVRTEQLAEAERRMDALSPDHRDVFILREVEGAAYEDIAATLGLEIGTVKSRLNRARAAIEQMRETA